jgi:hypothetical protein
MTAPTTRLRLHAAPLVSLALLAGVFADQRLFHVPVGDPVAYHARVRALADHVPQRIGDWTGTDVDAPEAAVALLRPNVLIGREFRHAHTGERATLLVVQCKDARDMAGHWPPVCYPAQGWTLREETQRTLATGLPGLGDVPVTVYRFALETLERYAEIQIYNFFIRPQGELESGRSGVRRAADNRRMKVFGAAQIQVVFHSPLPEARRDEIFRTLVAGTAPFVQSVRLESP